MEKLTKYRLSTLVFCILLQLETNPQSHDLKFKNYININGLENRNSIVRDSSGYIWLSGIGIARFDGTQLKTYRRNDNVPNSLPRDNTNNLIVDRNGTLWLTSGGLCYYDKTIDGFIYVNKSQRQFTNDDAVVYDGKETIWFCSRFGLYSVNINTKKMRGTSLKDCPYPNKAVVDNTGKVWLCLWRGTLIIYNPADDGFKKFSIYDNSKVANLRSIFITKQNKVWVAKDAGVIEIDPGKPTDENGSLIFKEVSSLQHVSISQWVRSMQYLPAYTGDSILWIATDSHGLLAFNTNNQQISATYLPDKSNPHSISSNTPRSLYVDKDNHLWVTQSNGLSLLNIYNQNFKSRILTELDEPYAYIISMQPDKTNKEIVWIGTDHGILKYNWIQKKTLQYIKNWGPLHASIANAINDDGEGNLWIGSGNTLYLYNKLSNVFTKYPPLPNQNKFGYENIINDISSMHDTILMASNTGLVECFRKQKKYKILYTGIDKGLDYNSFNLSSIRQDTKGLLWCGGAEGLLKFDLTTNQHQLYLFDDKKDYKGFNRIGEPNFLGDTIAIPASAGVVLFNKLTGQFSKLAPADDVELNNCWDLKVDSLHNLWINTYSGLVFYNRKTRRHKTFTAADGLPRSFSDVSLDMIDNTIVFKWRNKFAYIDPYSVEKNTSVPEPVITGFNIFDKPVLFDPVSVGKTPFNLSYTQNFLSFDFNAFEFNYPDKIQFAYRLKGFNKNWVLSGTQKNATYTNLSPGDYSFELKAANSEGLWSKPVVFMIFIKAAFWQTFWFKALLAFTVVIILYWLVQRRIKKIRKEEVSKAVHQRELLELELKTLRSQMNPHFLFNSLNSIQKFIWENNQEDGAEYLSKFSRLMRMILNNSMQKLVTLDQEIATLSLYVELEHRRSTNKFDYTITIADSLDTKAILVPPMLLQPYVENAIWHGLLPKEKPGVLKISIMPVQNNYLECTIEDNGIGRFANGKVLKKTYESISYGMQLTRQRIMMTEANGQHGTVEVKDITGKGTGTRVIIHLPLNSFIKL